MSNYRTVEDRLREIYQAEFLVLKWLKKRQPINPVALIKLVVYKENLAQDIVAWALMNLDTKRDVEESLTPGSLYDLTITEKGGERYRAYKRKAKR